MALFDDLQKKYVEARKAHDAFTTGVLSMLISDLKYEEINKDKELEDADVLAILQKTLKQKKDVCADFEKAGRTDLLEKEQAEVAYLQKLLPPMMSEDELRAVALAAKAETGASSPADMGKLMKEVMARVKGKAEGSAVKNIVTEVLKS